MGLLPETKRRGLIAVLIAFLTVALVLLIYPVYVIRPFRAQGARELAAALALMRLRPAADLLCCAGALAALIFYWRAQPRRWKRAFATLGAVLVCGFAALSRINIYELMFHPDERPAFDTTARTKLDKSEKVIAVKIGAAARAYPIRIISYHHVINDVLDKTAIVATY